MELKVERFDTVEEAVTVGMLLDARNISLEELKSLASIFTTHTKFERDAFYEELEWFKAADKMLQYFTTTDQYTRLTS